MTYNLTNMTGATTIPDFMISVNQSVGGIYGIALLLMIFGVSFASLKFAGTRTEDAFAVAGFLNVIVAIMFFAMEFVGGKALIFSILITGASIFWLYVDK